MEAVAVIAVLAATALACAVAGYERELRRMARFLRERERGGNERVTVGFSSKGLRGVAGAINADLDAARDERAAERASRERFQEDLASLSHDIRTPLAGAQGYLQLAGRARDASERQRCLREADARLSDMRQLVEQLFAYAKAADAHARLTLAPVEALPALAEELAGLYPALSAEGRGVQVDFEDEGFTVLADAEALSRIFGNLAANALRHGQGDVRIVQRSRRIVFCNAVPQGAHIETDRLFERFYRADAARTKAGSGLGLAIVARLAEAMGARVWARLDAGELSVAVEFPPEEGTALR